MHIYLMKKLILSFTVLIVFAFYALFSNTRVNSQIATATPVTTDIPSPAPSSTATSAPSGTLSQDDESIGDNTTITPVKPTATVTASATPTPVSNSGAFKNGSYTGSVEDVYYGNVQVKATVTGGKLSNVVFLQYPNDRNTSIRIANMAMPILKSEAIKAQSASVNIVSGATQTSGGFQKSLASALVQAAN